MKSYSKDKNQENLSGKIVPEHKEKETSVPVDAGGMEDISLKLHLLLEQQTFISDILRLLQETDDLPVTIHQIMGFLGEYCGATAMNIFEYTPDMHYVSNTFEWCRDGIASTKHLFQNVLYDNFPLVKEQFERHGMIRAFGYNNLPADLKEVFPYYSDDASIVLIAMDYNGKEMGFVDINRYNGVPWGDDEVVFVRKVVGVLATAIIRKRIEEELTTHKNDLERLVEKRTEEIGILNMELATVNSELFANNSELSELNNRLAEEMLQKDQVQVQLQQSELILRCFLEQIDEGIAILSGEGIIIHWNRCMETITGVAAGKAVGHSLNKVKDLFRLEDESAKGRILDILAQGLNEAYTVDVTFITPDETYKYCFVRIFPVSMKDEVMIGFSIVDFTERRKNEKELAQYRNHLEEEIKKQSHELFESETKFRTIVQQLSDIVVIVDIHGIIQYASPTVRIVLGYTPEEMTNTNVFGYLYPDDIGYALFELNKTKEEKIPEDELPATVSFRLLNVRGEVVIVEGIGRNELNNEAIGGIILTFRDVTAERINQQKVEENLERQQLMSRLLQELHYASDITGSLELVLSWLAEYAGVSSAGLIYWSSPEYKDFNRLLWKSTTSKTGEERLLSVPGEIYVQWAESIKDDFSLVYDYAHLPEYVKPYFTKKTAKRVYAFPYALHDTTCGMMIMLQEEDNKPVVDWEYHEMAFMQSVAQIISNAIERDTTQKNLIKAKERAEEADKLKSAFLANMSHEIRTPMNGIIGFASLMQKENTSVEQRAHYSQIINDNCQMLLQLLDDIIDISKLESNQLKISLSMCNINQLLSDLLLLFRQLLKKKGKDKVYIILEDNNIDETALIDPVRLQQIITNLVNNAIKFTDKGFISFGYLRHNDGLLFYVKDTGTGIPEEQTEIIFERFRQVEEHQERNLSGTGLGLAISRNLVELMGGKIWVESSLGMGSNFYFTINAKP